MHQSRNRPPEGRPRGIRSRRAQVATAAMVLVAGIALPAAIAGSAENAPTAANTVTWEDQFDGAAGSPPNPAKWVHDVGGDGWGNEELQYYTDGAENAALDGSGNLVITAREENPPDSSCWYGTCKYSSARLTTLGKFSQRYGRFEARIRVPRGQGFWPAFWLLGEEEEGLVYPASGEIDIMEIVGSEPSTSYPDAWGDDYSLNDEVGYMLPGGAEYADAFHTFSLDWEPEKLTWSVDGNEFFTVTPADLDEGDDWAFDHSFYILLNLAVGGTWPGSPDESTPFPAQMVV
ncbi:MAG TPA: glycoside hydrolase family 16 protein, partial [Mycobacteriales bacterium]|nr:glycoside hydrolase family 16 protein [Mycobacteriales bacterium]